MVLGRLAVAGGVLGDGDVGGHPAITGSSVEDAPKLGATLDQIGIIAPAERNRYHARPIQEEATMASRQTNVRRPPNDQGHEGHVPRPAGLTLRDETLRLWQQLKQLSSKSKPKHFEIGLFVVRSDIRPRPRPRAIPAQVMVPPGGECKSLERCSPRPRGHSPQTGVNELALTILG
jgi:hypothetical protein